MSSKEREFELLKNEDFIWVIYYFIITFALISNIYDRYYLKSNNKKYQKLSSNINTTIIIIAFFIYLYFVYVSWENIKILKDSGKQNEVRIALERLIVAIIFLVGGAYQIYVDYDANTTNADIAIF